MEQEEKFVGWKKDTKKWKKKMVKREEDIQAPEKNSENLRGQRSLGERGKKMESTEERMNY